ncbi:MAG TPA: molybdopterin molybdotransferase MoeA [Anaerolineales bacterium]|nr:molybdopterin molybdotransferase MoeA [Anaerolineales bacterium]
MIAFDQAYQLTLEHIHPLAVETVDLLHAVGRTAGQDILARVDSPSLDVSLKDGYAVLAADISHAGPDAPVQLNLVGSIAAGDDWQGILGSGEAVRILSGAPLPQGADVVVAEEFTRTTPGAVQVLMQTDAGRNVLRRGADVQSGQRMVPAAQKLSPTAIGLLAAAGHHQVPVVRRPRVAVLATGSEVLAPGQPLVQGKLYASNLFNLAAWCLHYGFEVETLVLRDDVEVIRPALMDCLERFDAVLTSGGAWKGEHDLVVQILDGLDWQKIYHRVRMGPGKAVGFGLFEHKPVFCLPGGPPSNHMAFIQLALPGLHKLAGEAKPGLPQTLAVMAEPISGQVDWTQFVHGRLVQEDQRLLFQPLKYKSRLQEMAQTEAIARIPEGQEVIPAGSLVMVQRLAS